MAIPQTKYVNIISAVGGASQVSQRDLMGRFFTSNPLVPAGAVVEFSGGSTAALKSVADYFGTASIEYTYASYYFSYVSKKGTTPQKISFAPYAASATSARLYGAVKSAPLTSFTALTNATLSFKVDNTNFNLTGINLASATSLSAVATIIRTAITTAHADTANIEYNETLQRFVISSVATGADHTITYATGTLAELLGMNAGNTGAVKSDSSAAQTALEALTESAELSNNFFSFMFIPNITDEKTAIAEWVHNQNVRYMWSFNCGAATASDYATALKDYDGVALTLSNGIRKNEILPMAVAAAINYDVANAAVDFMYQQAPFMDVSVSSATDAATYDALRVNYYGSTQQAGNLISFYQDGVLMGSITSMGVYTNEAWLKDAITTNILNLRLSLDTLPANETGLGYVKLSIQEIIEKALFNGVISVGKTLDSTQKAYVAQITGEADAWQDIQSVGYWLTAKVEKYTEHGVEKYKVNYLLVYAKGDSINFVDGRDILI